MVNSWVTSPIPDEFCERSFRCRVVVCSSKWDEAISVGVQESSEPTLGEAGDISWGLTSKNGRKNRDRMGISWTTTGWAPQ
jgi:hypothetical protein